jgi:hypothetical protein
MADSVDNEPFSDKAIRRKIGGNEPYTITFTYDADANAGRWRCHLCTFRNSTSYNSCEVCEADRLPEPQEAPQEHQHDLESDVTCSCGNTLTPDAIFCCGCGIRVREESTKLATISTALQNEFILQSLEDRVAAKRAVLLEVQEGDGEEATDLQLGASSSWLVPPKKDTRYPFSDGPHSDGIVTLQSTTDTLRSPPLSTASLHAFEQARNVRDAAGGERHFQRGLRQLDPSRVTRTT